MRSGVLPHVELPRVGAKKRSTSFQSPRDGATAILRVDAKRRSNCWKRMRSSWTDLPRVDAKKQGSSQRNHPAAIRHTKNRKAV
jgi:hypothetical protein